MITYLRREDIMVINHWNGRLRFKKVAYEKFVSLVKNHKDTKYLYGKRIKEDMIQFYDRSTDITTVVSYRRIVLDNNACPAVQVPVVPAGLFSGTDFRGIDLHNVSLDANTRSLAYFFKGCKYLKEVDLGDIDTSEVTSFRGMFSGCENLKKVNLDRLDTSRAEDMAEMFFNCFRLEEIDLSNMDTSRVRTMEKMFFTCPLLQEIDLITFHTGELENMNCMFYGCRELKSLDMKHFDASKVKQCYKMLSFCANLETLRLPELNTDHMDNFEHIAFVESCFSLKHVETNNPYILAAVEHVLSLKKKHWWE